MIGYIYKITNLINNKIYIGQHKSEEFDEHYFGSGILIKKSITKYGIKNFRCEIIEWCDNKEQLNEQEKYWIDKLKPHYNISKGGTGGDLGEQVNLKISNTLKEHWKSGRIFHHNNSGFKKGYIPWNKDKPGTFLGKHHSEETKKKLSQKLKGKKPSEKQCREHSERMKGHRCSEETREKMRLHNSMHNPVYREKARLARLKNLKKKKWMTNGVEDRLVELDSVDKYMHLGWGTGRVKAKGRKNKY